MFQFGTRTSVKRHVAGPSNRDSLDDVSCHFPLSPVVQACGPWVGVAGKVLHILKWNALREKIRHGRHSIMLSTT